MTNGKVRAIMTICCTFKKMVATIVGNICVLSLLFSLSIDLLVSPFFYYSRSSFKFRAVFFWLRGFFWLRSGQSLQNCHVRTFLGRGSNRGKGRGKAKRNLGHVVWLAGSLGEPSILIVICLIFKHKVEFPFKYQT